MKKGVLLINLGTPDACTLKAVRRYLREFLTDPRVIDLPWLARQILVNAFIIPFRTKKSTQAYQKIWCDGGSPLLLNSIALKDALAHALGENYQVALGMRYGNPSIQSALDQLKVCSSLIVLPLFPQYSSAASGSALEKVLSLVSQQWNFPDIQVKSSFYNNPLFIKAFADKIQRTLVDKQIDLLLFSYHGLPQRHILKSGCQFLCDAQKNCPEISIENANCYRAQCYATSRQLAKALGLRESEYAVSFQSRLGSTPWIKPYTDHLLPELQQKGIKNIAVVAPSFIADCLETLEEIDMQLRAQWLKSGGGEFIFVPSLNADAQWVLALKEWVKVALQ